MYNRYLRSDTGHYTRMSSDNGTSTAPPPLPEQEQSVRSTLERLLERLHLDALAERFDSSDLLLFLLILFLWREDADEEVLIALGLLLIL